MQTRHRVARFQPKRTDDLRPGMAEHIGKVFEFDYGFQLDDDHSLFPDQHVWLFARKYDELLGHENAGRWVPDEDLQEV